MRKMLFALIGFAVLAACAQVPVTSLPSLMSIKPETMNLAGLQVAIQMNEDLEPKPGSAKLVIQFTHSALEKPLAEEFVLVPVPDPLPSNLVTKSAKGFKVYRFRLNPEDEIRANQLRAKTLNLTKAKQNGGASSGANLAASTGFCISPGRSAPDFVFMTIYVRLAPEKDFIKLVKEQKFALGKDGKTKIETCNAK